MSMGVTVTAGSGMSGSGSAPVSTTVSGGVHSGTAGPSSLGPVPGSGIGVSSGGMGSSNASVGMGVGSTGAAAGGTMPPLGLDFMKVRDYLFLYCCFFRKPISYIFFSVH